MRNAIKKTWQQGTKITLLLLVLLTPGFAGTPPASSLTCPAPTAWKTAQGSNSVSFAWNPIDGATNYLVWYVRKEDNSTSSTFSTGSTAISFSSLPQGTYRFYFATNCNGDSSGYTIVDDLIIM